MSRATSSVGSQQQSNTMSVPREKVAMRAYEKWCKRGRTHGCDKQDWTDAENELRAEMNRTGGMQAQGRR